MRALRGSPRSLRGRACLGTAVLLGALFSGPPGLAQPPQAPVPQPPSYPPEPAADTEGISLEALLDTVVWIASRRDERVSAAAASITAYTEEDLRALGYYTHFRPGQLHRPAGAAPSCSASRCWRPAGRRRAASTTTSTWSTSTASPWPTPAITGRPIGEELPLFFARSVEFLRGPASALYGTSAFFGVVNVVPGDLEHEGSDFGLRLSAGTRDVERRLGAQAQVNDSVGSFRLAMGYYEKNASGTPLPPPPDVSVDPGNLFWDDQKSVFLNPTYTLRASALRGLGRGGDLHAQERRAGRIVAGRRQPPAE